MKKFKTGLLALALVVGVSGAFATKIHAAPKLDEDTYDWSRVAGSGEQGSLSGKTISEAQTFYGCDGAAATCAAGVNNNPSHDDAVIQLN